MFFKIEVNGNEVNYKEKLFILGFNGLIVLGFLGIF